LIDIGDDGMLGQCADGRKLWLRGPGVPGDEVAFEAEGKGGRISEILRPAHERREPACPHFGVCPGCQLQPLPYPRQLELKQAKIVETLRRLGGFTEVPWAGMVGSDEEYGTRNKLDFTIEGTDIGYRSAAGLVPVQTCPVGDPLLVTWIPRMRAWLEQHPGHQLHRLLLRTDGERSGVWVLLRGTWSGGEQESFLRMSREVPAAAGVSIQADWKQPWQTVEGEADLMFTLAGCRHRVPHDRFFQIHDRLADRLVTSAIGELEDAKGQRLLDLFCGSGAFTLPAAEAGFQVTGIDTAPPKGRRFQRADLRRGLPPAVANGSWQVVITDPPRTGMDKGLVNILRDRVTPEELVYVSCNPATLARDLKRLCGTGHYELVRVQGFDLFPQTTHVETLCHLRRR
jgi:23S rRNA (uracil1939-C5)-methyltransferase